jgi:Na+-translocating ferredoxin:NAD+ oxidoreductase RnfC subunit
MCTIVGDDYPSIVRTMKRRADEIVEGSRKLGQTLDEVQMVLWAKEFNAAVSIDTVRKMFPEITIVVGEL